MGVENFQSKAAEGKRAAKRARVLLAAKLQTKYGEIEARLRDLSRKGALVECLEDAGGRHRGRVRARQDRRAGAGRLGRQRPGRPRIPLRDRRA